MKEEQHLQVLWKPSDLPEWQGLNKKSGWLLINNKEFTVFLLMFLSCGPALHGDGPKRRRVGRDPRLQILQVFTQKWTQNKAKILHPNLSFCFLGLLPQSVLALLSMDSYGAWAHRNMYCIQSPQIISFVLPFFILSIPITILFRVLEYIIPSLK